MAINDPFQAFAKGFGSAFDPSAISKGIQGGYADARQLERDQGEAVGILEGSQVPPQLVPQQALSRPALAQKIADNYVAGILENRKRAAEAERRQAYANAITEFQTRGDVTLDPNASPATIAGQQDALSAVKGRMQARETRASIGERQKAKMGQQDRQFDELMRWRWASLQQNKNFKEADLAFKQAQLDLKASRLFTPKEIDNFKGAMFTIDSARSIRKRIEDLAKAEGVSVAQLGTGWKQLVASKVSRVSGTNFDKENSLLEQQIDMLVNDYTRSMTGLAATDQQMARYQRTIADIATSPDLAYSKLENLERLMALSSQRALELLEQGGVRKKHVDSVRKYLEANGGLPDGDLAAVPTQSTRRIVVLRGGKPLVIDADAMQQGDQFEGEE